MNEDEVDLLVSMSLDDEKLTAAMSKTIAVTINSLIDIKVWAGSGKPSPDEKTCLRQLSDLLCNLMRYTARVVTSEQDGRFSDN